MRLVPIVALLCACGGGRKPPLLFEPLPADQIRVDFAAIQEGPFRFKIGAQTIEPKLRRKSIPGGMAARGTFKNGSFALARVGKRVSGVFRDGKTGFVIVPTPAGHRLIPRSWKTARQLHGEGWDELAAQRGPKRPPTRAQTKVEIEVLFAYTPAVEETLGGVDSVRSQEIGRAHV